MALTPLGTHALAERAQRPFRAAVGDDSFDRGECSANACNLRLRLAAAADHAERRGALLGQVLGGDAARSAGTEPAEVIGLDDGGELRLRSVEERYHERRAVCEAGVHLCARVAEREVRSGHVRESSLLETKTPSRREVDGARGDVPKRRFDCGERVVGREELLNLLFGEVQRHAARLLLDEADLSARLEHGPLDVVERLDLLSTCFRHQLLGGQTLALQVLLDRLPVLDDDDRLALEQRPQAAEAKREKRRRHLHRRDRADADHRTGDGVVVLCQALLDRVTEDDQEDEVERLERRELAAPDHAREQIEEAVDRDSADCDVHYGNTKTFRCNVTSAVLPSASVTSWTWLPTFVGLTWNSMKSLYVPPAGM